MCVSRPAGADSPDEPSLHEWLVGTHPSVMTAAGTTRVCHNLDYATSGVVACAKSEGAAREVGRLFEARKARMLRRLCRISAASGTARPYLSGQARKLYAALVFGHPAWEERNISARIAVTARKFRQSVTKASCGKARPVYGMDEGGAGCSHKSTTPGPNRTISQTRSTGFQAAHSARAHGLSRTPCRLLPVFRRGDARVASPCPTTSCVGGDAYLTSP